MKGTRIVLAVLGAWMAVATLAGAAPKITDEYIIVSGGPSLLEWEKYRKEGHRHDRWWGNFIRTARIRFEQINKVYQGKGNVTWMVYRPG